MSHQSKPTNSTTGQPVAPTTAERKNVGELQVAIQNTVASGNTASSVQGSNLSQKSPANAPSQKLVAGKIQDSQIKSPNLGATVTQLPATANSTKTMYQVSPGGKFDTVVLHSHLNGRLDSYAGKRADGFNPDPVNPKIGWANTKPKGHAHVVEAKGLPAMARDTKSPTPMYDSKGSIPRGSEPISNQTLAALTPSPNASQASSRNAAPQSGALAPSSAQSAKPPSEAYASSASRLAAPTSSSAPSSPQSKTTPPSPAPSESTRSSPPPKPSVSPSSKPVPAPTATKPSGTAAGSGPKPSAAPAAAPSSSAPTSSSGKVGGK